MFADCTVQSCNEICSKYFHTLTLVAQLRARSVPTLLHWQRTWDIMASQYGQLSEYHPDTEGITSYLERVEVSIATNEVAKQKQAKDFLSVVGGRTFSLIPDLVSPAKLSTKTFQELCDVLRAHFEPKPIVIVERYILLPQSDPRFHGNHSRVLGRAT